MRKTRNIILLCAAILLAGCHGTKHTARTVEPPAAPAEEPTEEPAVTPVAQQKRTYTVVNFDGTVQGISVNGQLRMAEDSVMWVTVSKIIEVGRAMCTPDSLWLRAPLLGRDDAMSYADLRRITGKSITFGEMQKIATSDNAEEHIAALARQLGFDAAVRITGRRQVERLTFPYTKPTKP